MLHPKWIGVSQLKAVSIYHDGDVHDFALWVLKTDIARSTATATPRHTLKGLANAFARAASHDQRDVCLRFEQQGWSLGTVLEPDKDNG